MARQDLGITIAETDS